MVQNLHVTCEIFYFPVPLRKEWFWKPAPRQKVYRIVALTEFVFLRSTPSTRDKKIHKTVILFLIEEYNSWDNFQQADFLWNWALSTLTAISVFLSRWASPGSRVQLQCPAFFQQGSTQICIFLSLVYNSFPRHPSGFHGGSFLLSYSCLIKH